MRYGFVMPSGDARAAAAPRDLRGHPLVRERILAGPPHA